MSAACGTRRRCRICNTRIPHRTHYFHCSQNCRFTVCTACFRPSTQRANTGNDNARQRATSEPPQLQTAGDAVASVNPGLFGRAHFTRYSDLSLDAFIDKVNTLISEGRFAGIGVPQVRVEGTTAWGAWLRINHRHSTYGRRPQLLCGVLFHATNRRITFHGDASCTTHHVLPLFESWTREQIADLSTSNQHATCLDVVAEPDPDSPVSWHLHPASSRENPSTTAAAAPNVQAVSVWQQSRRRPSAEVTLPSRSTYCGCFPRAWA